MPKMSRVRQAIRFVIDNAVREGKLDSKEGIYFVNQLETIRTKLYLVKHPELKAFKFVPITGDVSRIAESVTIIKGEDFGDAELGSDYSEGGPSAEVSDERESAIIRVLKNQYHYSFMDAERAAATGSNLPFRRAKASRDGMATKADKILLIGDGTPAYLKLRGLFKLSGVNSYTVPAGVSGFKTFDKKSADEVLEDLCRPVDKIVEDTGGSIVPTDVILPLSMFNMVRRRKMGNQDQRTILQAFAEAYPSIAVDWSLRLETASATGTCRHVTYRRDPDVVEGLFPVEYEQRPPVVTGFNTVVHCHGRIGGVWAHHPLGVCYSDYPTS